MRGVCSLEVGYRPSNSLARTYLSIGPHCSGAERVLLVPSRDATLLDSLHLQKQAWHVHHTASYKKKFFTCPFHGLFVR